MKGILLFSQEQKKPLSFIIISVTFLFQTYFQLWVLKLTTCSSLFFLKMFQILWIFQMFKLIQTLYGFKYNRFSYDYVKCSIYFLEKMLQHCGIFTRYIYYKRCLCLLWYNNINGAYSISVNIIVVLRLRKMDIFYISLICHFCEHFYEFYYL